MTRSMRQLGHAAARAALCVFAASPAALAKTLSERLPGGAVIYAEWSGADHAGAAQGDTPFGKLVGDPDVKKLVSEVTRGITILLKGAAAQEGNADVAEAALNVLGTLWHRPVALDVLGVSMTETGPSVGAVLAVEVGGDRMAAFIESLERIAAMARVLPPARDESVEGRPFKRLDLPFAPAIRYGAVDDLFVITLGEATTQRVLTAIQGGSDTVARDPALTDALRKIGQDGRSTLSLLHVDVRAALDQARRMFAAMSGAEEPALPPPVEAVFQAASIDRLRSITATWQVDGNGFRETWFVALPPSDGRPKWLNQAALTDDDLALVPKDATFAKLANFRLADVYDGLLHVVNAVGPMAQAPFANAVATAEGAVGLHIRQDILDLLDDGWVTYISPRSGGLLITGITLLVEAKDPQRVSDLLARLARYIGTQADPGNVTVESKVYKEKTIQFVSVSGTPVPLAPAWCVVDRYVVMGLYPQTVMHAIDHLSTRSPSNSLLANPDFARARKRLPDSCSAIVYADTKAHLTDVYRVLLPLATAGCSWARGQGVQLHAGMLPTLSTVTDGLFGDVMGVSPGPDGLLFTTHGPLPISAAAAPPVVTALTVSVLLPSFAQSREQAKRTVSVANVKVIVTACHIYAEQHDGAFPPDLDALLKEGYLDKKTLHSPRDGRDRDSYIYVSGLTTDVAAPHNTILVYENPDIGDGSAVGFADGHAVWLTLRELNRRLSRAQPRPVPDE